MGKLTKHIQKTFSSTELFIAKGKSAVLWQQNQRRFTESPALKNVADLVGILAD